MPSQRKTLTGCLAGLLLITLVWSQGLAVLLPLQTASAADAMDPVFETLITLASWAHMFSHFMIYILVMIASMLLDPQIMNLSTNGRTMGSALLSLWQVSRNITNILLALLLVIGSVMTVVFAEGGYVQKYAVKFVLAVILVNFSWFFPRVILDLSNVLTATVYALPSELAIPCQATDKEGNKAPCMVITDFEFSKTCTLPFKSAIAGMVCIKEEEMNADANTPNSIFGGLIYNHARLRWFGTIAKPEVPPPLAGPGAFGRLPDLITFTMRIAMYTFFSLMLLFPLLALVLVLLIRIPVIWITVGFMPFMFLGFVAGDTPVMKTFNPMEIWNKFLHAAFLPVVVAIPFSVGFIMLNAVAESPPTAWDPLSPFLKKAAQPLLPGTNNLWQVVWSAMAVDVIWIGAKSAFKMDEWFNKVAGPIMSAGGSFGKLLAKLPLLAPLPIPLPGGAKDMNLGQALNLAKAPDRILDQKFYPPSFGGGKGGGGHAVDSTKAADILARRLEPGTAATNEHLAKIEQALNQLNGATTPETQRLETNNVRIAVNAAMGGEGSLTGTALEMQDAIQRFADTDRGKRLKTKFDEAKRNNKFKD